MNRNKILNSTNSFVRAAKLVVFLFGLVGMLFDAAVVRTHRFLTATAVLLLMVLAAPAQSLNPPGFSAVVAPRALISIRVVKYTPQVSRLEFYCATNRPRLWTLEDSADLLHWRTVESSAATNDFSPRVPMLRDNAQLVTWLLVSPAVEKKFYRVKMP